MTRNILGVILDLICKLNKRYKKNKLIKKAMIAFLSVLMISLMSCSKDEVKQNWIITVTIETTYSPVDPNFPMTKQTSTIEKNDLTEAEVKTETSKMASTVSLSLGAITQTTKVSATYAVKK